METRNAMAIRTDGEVAALLWANLDVTGTTHAHVTAIRGSVSGTSRHPRRRQRNSFTTISAPAWGTCTPW